MKNCIRPPYEKLKPLKSGFIENCNFENDRESWNRVSIVPSRGDVSLSFWGINGSMTVFPSSSFFQAACYFEHCSHQRESFSLSLFEGWRWKCLLVVALFLSGENILHFHFFPIWKWECILVWTLFQEGRPRPAQPPVLISPPNLGNNFLQTFGRTKLPFSGAMISSTESSCAKPWNVFFAASRPQFPNIYGSLAGWSLFVKTSHRK